MSARWPWSVLGLKGPADVRDVKRAYAKTLKSINRDDAAVFQDLRDAFEAAKSRAAVRESPKKPSMREAALGQLAEAHAMPAASDPTNAEAPATLPLPTADVAEDVQNPAPDRTPDPEPDIPEGPVSRPSKAPPGPWQAGSYSHEPDMDEEDKFFADLNAALSGGVWKLTALEDVLGRNIAMDRDIRNRAEMILFDRLAHAVDEDEHTIPRRVANLMEQHFDWASDGVRFNKKFGWRSGAQMVSYDVARALDRTHRIGRPNTEKTPLHGKAARVGMATVLYMGGLFVLWTDGLSEKTYLFAAVIAAITFGIMWCLVAFAYAFLSVLGNTARRIPAIDSLADRIWTLLVKRSDWVAQYDTAMHMSGPRSTIFFVFGFLASMAILCTWGMSRLS